MTPFQIQETKTAELLLANKLLNKSKVSTKEHAICLDKIMFSISHRMRQPIVNILGLTDLLLKTPYSMIELKKMIRFLRLSAQSLDKRTRELTSFVYKKVISSEKGNIH
jgi:hypothetical protein